MTNTTMTIDESKVMWELEKQKKEEVKDKMTPKMLELFDTVSPLIESGKLLYDAYVEDVIDNITKIMIDTPESEDTSNEEENRKEAMNKLCDTLIEKYKNFENNEETDNK